MASANFDTPWGVSKLTPGPSTLTFGPNSQAPYAPKP